jgi:hypothetical protein
LCVEEESLICALDLKSTYCTSKYSEKEGQAIFYVSVIIVSGRSGPSLTCNGSVDPQTLHGAEYRQFLAIV